MRSTPAILWLSLLTAITSTCQQHQPATKQPTKLRAPTGVFVGLDEMRGMPPEKPGDKWYHENIVYIRPDSLYLEGNPIIVSKDGEKGYSSSDGGFYSYSGRIDTTSGKLVAKLLMFAHDYLAEPVIIKDFVAANSTLSLDELVKRGAVMRDSSFYKKTFTITLTPKGFAMNGVSYVRLPADSLPNVFPVDFPASKRFFGEAARRYGR